MCAYMYVFMYLYAWWLPIIATQTVETAQSVCFKQQIYTHACTYLQIPVGHSGWSEDLWKCILNLMQKFWVFHNAKPEIEKCLSKYHITWHHLISHHRAKHRLLTLTWNTISFAKIQTVIFFNIRSYHMITSHHILYITLPGRYNTYFFLTLFIKY